MKLFQKGELKLLWPFYLEYFTASLLYLIPAFMVVYFTSLSLSFTQIGILLSIIPLFQFIFEVPTGAIADLYGRKFSVLLGYILEAICVLAMFFFNNYYAMLIIFAIWGIGGTFSSGSKDAWIVDILNKKDKNLINHFFGRMQFIIKSGLVLSGFLGAFLVKVSGLKIIWLMTFFSYIISITILGLLTSENYKKHKIQLSKSLEKVFVQSKRSIHYSIKHPVIFYLLVASFFMMVSVTFSDSLGFVPFLKSLGLSDYAFGYFHSIYIFIGAIAGLFAKKMLGKHKEVNFLIMTTAVGSLILCGTYLANNLMITMGIIFIAAFFFSLEYPIYQPYFHKFIPTKMRATIGSFQSMIFEIAGIISLPLGGYLVDIIGAKGVIIISAFLGIPSIIAYLLVKEEKAEPIKQEEEKPETC
jgi:MFS family permease